MTPFDQILRGFDPYWKMYIFFKCSCEEMVFVTNVTYNYMINFIHKKKVLRMGIVPSNHMEIIFQSEHPTLLFNPLGKSTVVSIYMVGFVGCIIFYSDWCLYI